MIGSIILPHIYRDFCSLHPDISLEIVEDGRNELLDKLSENYLDMVFLLQNKAFVAISTKNLCMPMQALYGKRILIISAVWKNSRNMSIIKTRSEFSNNAN